MSDLACILLPKASNDEAIQQQASNMRELRLLSLQTDPSSFFSRYEDEVDKPLQFTIDRINNPIAVHFIAVDANQASRETSAQSVGPYHAFLVMIKKEPVESSNTREYSMEAIYVRPTYRGQGVCTCLMKKAIQTAEEDFRAASVDEAIIRLTVTESNLSAHRLYAKLGFQETSRIIEINRAGQEIPAISMVLRLSKN